MAHRLVAVLALLAITTIVMVCFGNRPWLMREGALALAMLALTIGLAVLGRWTARCANTRRGDRESARRRC